MCSSLRGKESRLYHYSENLQGCGHQLENFVGQSFKDFIASVLGNIGNSKDINEILCLLESLKWKYQGEDFKYLAELNIFTMLRGNNKESLLR